MLSREGTVGIAAIVPPAMIACMGQRLVQIKPNTDKTLSEYLLWYLLQVLDPDRISHIMVGSTAQHLNVKDLKQIKVPLPPLGEQHLFKKALAKIQSLNEENEQSSRKL